MTAPQAPPQPRTFRVSQLRGAYVLQMTSTVGRQRGDRVLADVTIGSDSGGTATVRGRWPAYFSLTRDSAHRGNLDILFDDTRRLSFILGNPHLRTTDTGVILDVFTVDKQMIVGRWVDGGLGVDARSGLHPQGWFCLQRRLP